MTRFKKIFLWITSCFIICMVFLFILMLYSDNIINQKQILDKIQDSVSIAINGQATLQHIHVSFFPRPKIVFQQCLFSIPETVKGTIETLYIYPRIFPFIVGKFQYSGISLNTSDIEIYLNLKPNSEDKQPHLFSLETIEAKTSAILNLVLSITSGLKVKLKHTRLNIFKEKKPYFRLQDINAGIKVIKDHINLEMHCDTDLWKNISLKGAVNLSKDNLLFSLENLKLSDPRFALSGKLNIHHALPSKLPKINLELTGKDVDVTSTRKAAMNLAGNIPVVNNIFKMVKGGEIPFIQFTSHGNSTKELGKLKNISIKSNLTKADIFVPEVDLDLTDVVGNVAISEGILRGKNLKASMGSSKCLDGSLELGLEGKNALFHLDLPLEADLAQLPPILKRVVHNRTFVEELSNVDNVKGRATGRLVLGERMGSIKVFVDVSQFNLSANYRRLPRSLKITSGQYVLQGNTTSIKYASGRMGNSTFTDISGQMTWESVPHLEIASGRAKIDLKEISPWVLSSKTMSEKLWNLKNIKGTMAISSMRLSGPFFEPMQYQYQLAGDARNLTIDLSLFPELLVVPSGKFSITTKKISMTDVQARIHDTSLKLSGTVNDYLKDFRRVDMTFKGEIGPDAARWVEDALNISPSLRIKPPISVSTAHLMWNNQQQTVFSGDLSIKKGPKIATDFSITPEELIIEKLIIQDQVSNASIKLGRRNRIMDVLFAGNLQKETLDKVLEKNDILKGHIKGDLYAHVLLDQPLNSTLKGELTVDGCSIPRKKKPPLVINDLFLTAKRDILKVTSAKLALADNAFDIRGNVTFSADAPKLDMEIFSDALNLDQLKQNLNQSTKNTNDQTAEPSWAFSIHGLIKAKIKNLTYHDLTWEPFEADIRFKDRVAVVSVLNANVCGITTLGKLEIMPHWLSIDLKPFAQNQELNRSERCFLDQSAKFVGDFNFEGNIKTKGTAQTLMQNLHGNLKFYASKGLIHAGRDYRILIKIFNILNVTDIFKGKLSNPEANGFAYNSIHAQADIKNGKLVLKEMIIDGTSMNIVGRGYINLVNKKINVTAQVTPLKTIDFFIKRTPLIKDIFGGSLFSYPIGIVGHLDNPRVVKRPISDVDSGLLGIIKKTLQLPVKIIQPVLPDEQSY